MNIIDVLEHEKPVFVIDDVEDKKTKLLIEQINNQMKTLISKLEECQSFLNMQLQGEYHNKLVLAKSLQNKYENWITVSNACLEFKNKETKVIDNYYKFKEQLVNNLKTLLNDCKKLPVICVYDVFNDEYVFTRKGHNVVILGTNNVSIIETIIKDIENNFQVDSNYDEVSGEELDVNYSNVYKNVEECKRGLDSLNIAKASKEEKILDLIQQMEDSGKELVFFATYKQSLKNIGCNAKEVEIYEKELFKKYIPLKKQLKKLLKVEFDDICDFSGNNIDFPTQEFKSLDDFFEE